jgi:hypothetical protein
VEPQFQANPRRNLVPDTTDFSRWSFNFGPFDARAWQKLRLHATKVGGVLK